MRRPREIPASQIGMDLDQIPDYRRPARSEIGWEPETGWVWLSGLNPWDASAHFACYLKVGPCEVCEDRPIRDGVYCLGCDQTGQDGRRDWPGLAVDSAGNPDWVAETQPAYRPDPRLKGGKGRRLARSG